MASMTADPSKIATAFPWVFEHTEPMAQLPNELLVLFILLLLIALVLAITMHAKLELISRYVWERVDALLFKSYFKGKQMAKAAQKAEDVRIRTLLAMDIADAFEARIDKKEMTEDQVQKIYKELVPIFPVLKHGLNKPKEKIQLFTLTPATPTPGPTLDLKGILQSALKT